MKIRKIIAVWAAKCAEKVSVHIFHRQGVTWAGKIALKIYPNILSELSKGITENIFVVCGTNGKTTTNNMLCAALEAEGKKVVCNHTGSNMLNGVVAAFVLACDWKGRLEADCACIEIDEASTRRVFPFFKPDYMVLTNLFRDQLDRYGEIDITMNILNEVMQSAPDMKVIVNGDDALSAFLAMNSGNAYITYGISEKVVDDKDTHEIREGRFCKKCGALLSYSYYHYSQLGDYACTECDFKRPEIRFSASDVELTDGLSFTVEEPSVQESEETVSEKKKRLSTSYKGLYNIYNILAAYTAVKSAGYEPKHFQKMLDDYNPENGRMEEFEIKGTKTVLNLAKNPAGFNQNISAVMQDASLKDVIIVINDNLQDGTDISWLWDVDFDRLKNANVNAIVVSGIRCQDMRLRLKYTDMKAMLEADVEKAICERIENGCGNLYVLVNYTALFSTRGVLKRLEGSRS